MSFDDDLQRWHRILAKVIGEMALSLVRRRLPVGALSRWTKWLEQLVREMRKREK